MTVQTERYKFNHKRNPRGYGWWWFKINGSEDYSFPGLYSDAKTHAKAYAKKVLNDKNAKIELLP